MRVVLLLNIAKHDESSFKMKKTNKEKVNTNKEEEGTDMSLGQRKESNVMCNCKIKNDGKVWKFI
jgi:hypothetical protein